MLLSESPAVSFDDVLIVPQHTNIRSRADVKPEGFIRPMKIPVFASCMDTITEAKMLRRMEKSGAVGILHRYMSPKKMLSIIKDAHLLGPQCVAVGLLRRDKERIDLFINAVKERGSALQNLWFCIDIAHGDCPDAVETIEYIKEHSPTSIVIGPNVATPEGVCSIAKAGAELVRVGIGGGSVCTTRIKTGCGLPTLQSLLDCRKVAEQFNIAMIADGGVREPGDVAKALAGGARGVIIGGMLAGTDATPHWTAPGAQSVYRGMASGQARKAFTGKDPTMVEGAQRVVKCKAEGSTAKVITEIEEGVRSAMSYVGAHTAQEFHQNANLRRHTSASMKESHPHFADNS